MVTLMLIFLVVVEFTLIAFAAAILRSKEINKLSISFLLLLITLSAWIALNYLSNTITLAHDTLVITNRLLFVSSTILLMCVLYFVEMATTQIGKRGLLGIAYVGGVIGAIISFSELVVADVYIKDNTAAIKFGDLMVAYFSILGFIAALIVARLIASSVNKNKRIRSYSRVLLWSIGLTLLIVMITNVLIPIVFHNFAFVQLGSLLSVLTIAGVGYSVARHRLFDIKFAVVRSIAYTGVLLTLSAAYYLFAYIISVLALGGKHARPVEASYIDIIPALGLAFLFQPIKRFFDRATNGLFYKDNYKSDEFFARISEHLTSTTDLRGLLQRASQEIASTLKIEQCFFFLHYTNSTEHYMTAGTTKHSRLLPDDARLLEDFVVDKNDALFVTEQLDDKENARRLLEKHKVAVLMPLRHKNKTIGYLYLGDRLAGGYTKKDIKAIKSIANELVIAIQNALSVHEVREINATLQQRIDTATKELRDSNAKLRHLDQVKDEFMSMASHQLRTPLTSVKGYMSMVLEGDAGEISPQQRHLLTEAFKSSERMVHLIADFLSVSRLQTGKFVLEQQEGNLEEVVKQEIDALKLVATSHNMRLIYKKPAHVLPTVQFDEAKIRQVIMNFIDNAIYYSRGGTSITIALALDTNKLSFTVTDTGIGVPKHEQQHLFTKFFRAKNARRQRPDGTGIGLFLAKKIIIAHGGSMIFHSVEDKGSTFGFRLPLS